MAATYFAQKIIQWHNNNPRPLPWTGGLRNAYTVWLSEIIMQQTRIEQGAAYYHRFISTFPTITDLAQASTDHVLKLWQGLGYYTRARNLHKTAQFIVSELNGAFPRDYPSLLKLPGVGPYSAAAIASFAYGLPHAVVDGNVKRVIARYFGIKESIDLPPVHERIREISQHEMIGSNPGDYNQAIMNFGSLICSPKPSCELCPLRRKCYAFKNQLTTALPLRSAKKEMKTRYFHFIVLHYKNKIWLQQRSQRDIWKGLYAPPVIETNSIRMPRVQKIKTIIAEATGNDRYALLSSSHTIRQKLTHRNIVARFHHIAVDKASSKKMNNTIWVNATTVHDYGKPRMIVQMIEELFTSEKSNRSAAGMQH